LAGTDSARTAPQVKPSSKRPFRLFIFVLPPVDILNNS
jgi:hypothetical protein